MNKTLKVLLLSPSPEATGGIASWTRHVLNYYNSLEKDLKPRFEFSFLPMGRSKFITVSTSFISRLVNGVLDYFSFILKYKKVIRKEKPSVVHITSSASLGLFKDLFLEKINNRKGIKTIIHFRFGRIPELALKKNWEWRLLKRVIDYADRVIVLDEKSIETLEQLNFSNIILLPNPITPTVLSLIQQYNAIERMPRRILFAGHMVPTKGVFELVESCVLIPNIELILLGKLTPHIKEELLNVAKKKGDIKWLNIVGELPFESVIKEMLSCAVFVLPTYTEGFPNVILESMACACPIVATPVGAIPEMLNINNSNRCGVCVPVKDIVALRVAIEKYLDDEMLAQTHGNMARKRVFEVYSMPKVWTQMETIWEEV